MLGHALIRRILRKHAAQTVMLLLQQSQSSREVITNVVFAELCKYAGQIGNFQTPRVGCCLPSPLASSGVLRSDIKAQSLANQSSKVLCPSERSCVF